MEDKLFGILFKHVTSELRHSLTLMQFALEKLHAQEDLTSKSRKHLNLAQKGAKNLIEMVEWFDDPEAIYKNFLTLQASYVPLASTLQSLIATINNPKEKPTDLQVDLDIAEEAYGWLDIAKVKSILNHLITKETFSTSTQPSQLSLSLTQYQALPHSEQLPNSYKNSQEKQFLSIKIDNVAFIPSLEDLSSDFSEVSYKHYDQSMERFIIYQFVKLHQGTLIHDPQTHILDLLICVESNCKLEEESSLNGNDVHLSSIYTQNQNASDKPLPQSTSRNKAAKHGKIVVVEDDEAVRTLLYELLDTDYHVFTAGDGEEGYSLIQRELPDLIISDLKMPKKDGAALCRDIKQNDRTFHIPVILLTAFTDIEDRLKGLKTGADHYISKPFHSQELLLTIKNDLNLRQAIQKRFFKDVNMESKDMGLNLADQKFLDCAVEVVGANMDNPEFKVGDFCAKLNMASATCNRRLKKITGLTSHAFMTNIRLKKAAKLLLEGEYNVGEIAVMVGFSDQRYFSRIFKEHYELPPLQYVRQMQEQKSDSDNEETQKDDSKEDDAHVKNAREDNSNKDNVNEDE